VRTVEERKRVGVALSSGRPVKKFRGDPSNTFIDEPIRERQAFITINLSTPASDVRRRDRTYRCELQDPVRRRNRGTITIEAFRLLREPSW